MSNSVPAFAASATARRLTRTGKVTALALLIVYARPPSLQGASDPIAPVPQTEKSVRDLESSWAQFVQDRAAEQIRALLFDDFVFVDAAGAVKGRQEYLNDIRSGKASIEEWRVERLSLSVVGGTVVASSTVGVIGLYDRHDVSGFYQVTDVFIREAEGWRALSRQQTRIATRTDPLHERVGQPDGNPRVVLFVKGSFCPHCMAQLSTFANELSKRKYAVTVVSADTEEDLRRFPDVPFKLVADPLHKLFRKFGAFKDGPLHATLALDGQGAVVFRTVGNTPFMMADVVSQWVEKAAAAKPAGSADDSGQ